MSDQSHSHSLPIYCQIHVTGDLRQRLHDKTTWCHHYKKNACLQTLIASKDPNDKCPRQWPTDLWSWQWQWSAETYSTFWLSTIIAHIRLLIWKPYDLEHYMYTPLHKPRLIYIHIRNSSEIYLAKLSEKSSWTF